MERKRLFSFNYSAISGLMLILCATPFHSWGSEISRAESQRTLISNFYDKSEFIYFLRLNGPAINGPFNQNYNVFTEGPWPLQFYHELTYEYHFNWTYSAGIDVAGAQDLVHGVKNKYGTAIEPQMTVFRPSVYFEGLSVFSNSWMYLDTKLNLFIPTSEFDRRTQTLLFVLALDPKLNFRLPWPKWSANFSGRISPSFYGDSKPKNVWDQKQTLFLSAGHFLGYKISDTWELTNSSIFDFNHWTGKKPWFGSAAQNHMQTTVNYYLKKDRAHFGAYLQNVLDDPSWKTTIYGVEMTFNLLQPHL